MEYEVLISHDLFTVMMVVDAWTITEAQAVALQRVHEVGLPDWVAEDTISVTVTKTGEYAA